MIMNKKYKVPCITEGVDVIVWAAEKPTTCPNDDKHEIDKGGVKLIKGDDA